MFTKKVAQIDSKKIDDKTLVFVVIFYCTIKTFLQLSAINISEKIFITKISQKANHQPDTDHQPDADHQPALTNKPVVTIEPVVTKKCF